MTEGLYGSNTAQNAPRVAAAELIGSFFLVLAGTSVAVAASIGLPIAGSSADSLTVAVAFGFTLVALVSALGHVSGCHLNPAVTISLAVSGAFPWKYVPYYLGAQLIGAVAASLTVWATYGDAARDLAALGATRPVDGVSSLTVFAIEAIVTFFLVLTIVSVATDSRVPKASAALAVGLTLAACVLIAGPLSGGAVNPARALGPMIATGRFDSAWAYLIGPLLGGVLAGPFYARFLAAATEPSEAGTPGPGGETATDAAPADESSP